MTTIHDKVAEALTQIAPKVEGKVVDALVERELNKRAEAITKGIDILARLKQEGYKLSKPDLEAFDRDGKPTRQEYSSERVKAIQEHNKQYAALEGAINAALEKADFSKLYEKVNKS